MGCGMTLIKYLMFFFNFLVFLSGAVLIGLSVWVMVSSESFANSISSEPRVLGSAYIIVAVGVVLFIVGFVGCCGAIKENRCLLGTFFAIILIMFLLQLVGAILVIVLRPQAENEERDSMGRGEKDIVAGWDLIHRQYNCCGLDGPANWKDIPVSCCEEHNITSCNATNAYSVGCKEKFGTAFLILSGTAFGILLIEILAMIFSFLLFREIGKSPDIV